MAKHLIDTYAHGRFEARVYEMGNGSYTVELYSHSTLRKRETGIDAPGKARSTARGFIRDARNGHYR